MSKLVTPNTRLLPEVLYYIGDFTIILNEQNNHLKVAATSKYTGNMDVHPICDNSIICKPIDSRKK